MEQIDTLFATKLYRAELADAGLIAELFEASQALALDDEAGIAWCERNDYPGYTSYASLDDLPWRFPIFKTLTKIIERHAKTFAKNLDFDLSGGKLALDSIWVNVLRPGGLHTAHIHPHSVISGTFYVAVPEGAGALRLEDPRLGLMMAAPPKKPRAAPENRAFVSIVPRPGTLLLWESWLRHEVPKNRAEEDRISVSFNVNWR